MEYFFEEYLKQTEPNKKEKGYAWTTAIGLQAVDGLTPSKYLIDTAIQNIEGNINIDQAEELLNTYYKENSEKNSADRVEEADKVSLRITKILSENAFTFAPSEYLNIHKRLFEGIYQHAGKLRDYNISKEEWVLDGETVIYGSARELMKTLEYDFSIEQKFEYRNLSDDEIIKHLANFVSRLWQIHAFGEGNTRTTAVFLIKYLRTMGYDVSNEGFSKYSWYFRNALVRANYNDVLNGVYETTEYLEKFLRNLLLGEENELQNRDMHISGLLIQKPDIEIQKPDIEIQKPDIERNIRHRILNASEKTIRNICMLYKAVGEDKVFGRKFVEDILDIKSSRASEIISLLLDNKIIEPVKGYGKGKYIFKI